MPPSLLTAVNSSNHVHLIIGSNPLAGARCAKSIEVGAVPKLVASKDSIVHYGLKKRIDDDQIAWIRRDFREGDLTTMGRAEVGHVVDAVFVTLDRRDPQSTHISNLCRRLRIPINVADSPVLSTFTLLSTHTDGPLQIGVTTSGRGCKLSARIKREIVASLPNGMGTAVSRLGTLRRRLIDEDNKTAIAQVDDLDGEEDDATQPATFNQLVSPGTLEAERTRRMRWLSQICEYWPLKRLCAITDGDTDAILSAYKAASDNPFELTPGGLDARLGGGKGKIILAGSGPGHPELLTGATLTAIQSAQIILADKLVPAPVLDLIPRRTTVHIARKFPGNAEAAQEELLELGLAGVKAGQTVLRLKQGDPYLYGRGGEEVIWFRQKGYEPLVLPGITSALSAPLFAGIPVTQRSVSDQVLICTGTGRAGKAPPPPEYVKTRTVVFLMALHRLASLVESLTSIASIIMGERPEGRTAPEANTKPWPTSTPCAIIERASCKDQRVIRSTLEHVCLAVEELGSRPPGLLVVGEACKVLHETSDRWTVEEGFSGLDVLQKVPENVLDTQVTSA
jgi:uroporphyrin-III C-methyltransferase